MSLKGKSIVLDIETLQGVDFSKLRRKGGFFRKWTDSCWKEVLPAQVCAVLLNEDGTESGRLSCTIKPDWPGDPVLNNPYCNLTDDMLQEGLSPPQFFEQLQTLSSKATRFVGYNVGFDMGVLRHHAALFRRSLPDITDLCLMRPAANAVDGKKKWMKLLDAYEALTSQKADKAKAHDADYDVYMTIEIFKKLYLPLEITGVEGLE